MNLQNTCPSCRKNIDRGSIGRDLLASQIIDEIEVFCCNPSCTWRGPLERLKAHIEKCDLFNKKIVKKQESANNLNLNIQSQVKKEEKKTVDFLF